MAQKLVLVHGDREYTVELLEGGRVRVDGNEYEAQRERGGMLRIGGRTAWIAADGDARWVFWNGRAYDLSVRTTARRRGGGHAGSTSAPMPATVRRVLVAVGDAVKAGDPLIILEAMKMELPIRAASSGTVRALRCREGELVQPGVPLVEIE